MKWLCASNCLRSELVCTGVRRADAVRGVRETVAFERDGDVCNWCCPGHKSSGDGGTTVGGLRALLQGVVVVCDDSADGFEGLEPRCRLSCAGIGHV
eukprot:1142400-Pleurochrysis_carterae.AAC.2